MRPSRRSASTTRISAARSSTINASSHPFFDKHDDLIKSIWSIDKSNGNAEEKLAKLKAAVGSKNPSQLCDIFDEKTGQSRAKVTPLIIACFEGDFHTIEFLLNVRRFPSRPLVVVTRDQHRVVFRPVPTLTNARVNTI